MSNRYLIANLLEGDLSKELWHIQHKYRVPAWKERIGPHITLLRPFVIIENDVAGLTAALGNAARSHMPFPVNISGVDIFANRQEVIYAKVIRSKKLLDLQSHLATAAGAHTDSDSEVYDFNPHITLSNKLTSGEADAQFAEISHITMKHEFICRDFDLLRLNPVSNCWETISRFPLERFTPST